MAKTDPTLAERAQISRKIAASHRVIAKQALAVADRHERDAVMMEQGVDPFDNGKRVRS